MQVLLVARTALDWNAIFAHLENVGADADEYVQQREDSTDGAGLVEFAGRLCYRSFEPGLNANVTRVRADQEDHIRNLLQQRHGSVLEHVNFTFLLEDVSRILTHELVRHRAGAAFSQESMRYVRLDDIHVWEPDWALEDAELRLRNEALLTYIHDHMQWMTEHFRLDEQDFATKKQFTSYMRRWAPAGHTTAIQFTANVRALRHVIQQRTALGAEEEIRRCFLLVARMARNAEPLLFQDMLVTTNDEVQFTYEKV